jgi:hypothetical protein
VASPGYGSDLDQAVLALGTVTGALCRRSSAQVAFLGTATPVPTSSAAEAGLADRASAPALPARELPVLEYHVGDGQRGRHAQYEEDTVLNPRPEPFHHVDKNTLRKVAEPRPNPRARKA